MDIQLRFVNNSQSGVQNEIVLFQKNVATDMDEFAIAWKVIRYCGLDCYHPFVYSTDCSVAISDEYGNYSPRTPALDGQLYAVRPSPAGRQLVRVGPAPSPRDIQVANELQLGAVNVNLYRGKTLLAAKRNVPPQMKAVFQFTPTLWIGVASQVIEGQALNSAVISAVNTELSLLGVASADIIMTGGGGGASATPYEFTLANVVKA